MSDFRYIGSGTDGWLNVRREPPGAIIALPEYVKVDVSASRDGRDYFVVLEGVEKGNKFSVKTGNLKAGNPGYRSAASLVFSLSREELTYAGGKVRAITAPSNPIPIGVHPIQLPDFPHDGGSSYLGQSRQAKTWFHVGYGHAVSGSNARYLHPGVGTLGCITVDPAGWTALYQYLALCRSANGKTVGSVSVVR